MTACVVYCSGKRLKRDLRLVPSLRGDWIAPEGGLSERKGRKEAKRNESNSKMFVVKRDGRKEDVKFDKITSRINKLCYGLDNRFVDSVKISQKVGVVP